MLPIIGIKVWWIDSRWDLGKKKNLEWKGKKYSLKELRIESHLEEKSNNASRIVRELLKDLQSNNVAFKYWKWQLQKWP